MKYKMIFLLIVCAIGACTYGQNRPNIILIMADDMGYSDIGCYGGEIKTPNLDQLAQKGIRFTQFKNNTRCCPTRAALLTGLYPHQAGVGGMVGNGYGDLSKAAVTLAEALKTNGYATYMTGKWHVADSHTINDTHNWPIQRGFDKFYGTINGAGSYFDPYTLTRNNTPIHVEKEEEFYYTDAISDRTVAFIDTHMKKNSDAPFFCYVAYTAPHWPLHAKQKDIAKYKGVFDKGWDVLREERLRRMKKMGIVPKNTQLSARDFRSKPWESIENKTWELQRMQTYAAQIDNMDQGIGRIMDQLKSANVLDNTVVMFLSDNGGCAETLQGVENWVSEKEVTRTKEGFKVEAGNDANITPGPATSYMSYGPAWANLSNTPYRKFKKSGHEGGVSTPFIFHWPKEIKKGNIIQNQLASIIDIMPTILELSETDYPLFYKNNKIIPLEGLSLMPLLQNKKLNRDEWFVEHGSNKAYRKGAWKIAWSKDKGDKKWELFNLEKDPTEQHNLSMKHPEKMNKMISVWKEWASRVNVTRKK